MSNLVLTSGSAYIDIDAYSSCIAYRELLLAQGISAKAVTTAPLNESVSKIIREIPLSFDNYKPTDQDKFIILDVSEPNYIDRFVEQSRVVELLDHHTGNEEYWNNLIGDKSQIIKIGSVATMIFEKFVEAGKEDTLTQDVCKLLIAAIVDNTLNLKSGTTIDRDIHAFNRLMEIGGIDPKWTIEYLEDCEKSILADLKDSIKRDTKTLSYENLPKLVAQMTVYNHDKILNQSDLIKDVFVGQEDWVLNIISLKSGKSHFLTNSIISKTKLEKLFGKKFVGGVLELDKFKLRKEIFALAQNQMS